MDQLHGTFNIDDRSMTLYGHDSCIGNPRRRDDQRTIVLPQFVNPLAKPSFPLRASTAATMPLSSCSSHTKTPSCSSSHSSWILDALVNDNFDIDQDEEDGNSLEMLMILSSRYSEGCRLLEKRLRRRSIEMQYLYIQVADRAIGKLLSSATYKCPPSQDSLSRNHSIPILTTKKPSCQVNTKLHLCDVTRKQEINSEANQKPPAPKCFGPTMVQPNACSSPALAATTMKTPSTMDMLGLTREEVQQQREILEDIWYQNRHSTAGYTPRQFAITKAAFKPIDSNSQNPGWTSAPEERLTPGYTSQANRTGRRLSSSCRVDRMITNDRVTRLSNGEKVMVKGTRHTYKAIIKGRATLVQCPSCHTMQQICDTAKRLYCVVCQVVSPIAAFDSGAQCTSKPSVACTAARVQWDDQIARVLQRQEIHVARSMKQAKQETK